MRHINSVNMCGCFPSLPSAYSDSLSYYEQLEVLTNTMNDIISALNDDYTKLVKQYLDKYFNSIMIDATYKENTKTLVLSKIAVADGVHTYDPKQTAMIIKGEN